MISAHQIKDFTDKFATQSQLLSRVEAELLISDKEERQRRVITNPQFVDLCAKCVGVEDNTYKTAKNLIEQMRDQKEQVSGEYRDKI